MGQIDEKKVSRLLFKRKFNRVGLIAWKPKGRAPWPSIDIHRWAVSTKKPGKFDKWPLEAKDLFDLCLSCCSASAWWLLARHNYSEPWRKSGKVGGAVIITRPNSGGNSNETQFLVGFSKNDVHLIIYGPKEGFRLRKVRIYRCTSLPHQESGEKKWPLDAIDLFDLTDCVYAACLHYVEEEENAPDRPARGWPVAADTISK